MTQPSPVSSGPEWRWSACDPAALEALAGLLELGLPVEALAALATVLRRQTEAGQAGRASLHVDTPPGSGPAGVVVLGAGDEAARTFLCRRVGL